MPKKPPPPIDPDADDREDTVVEAADDIRRRFVPADAASSSEEADVWSTSRSAEPRPSTKHDVALSGLTAASEMPGLSDLALYADESEEDEATAILPQPQRAASSRRDDAPVVPLANSNLRVALEDEADDDDDATQYVPVPRALDELQPLDADENPRHDRTMSNPVLFRQTVQPSGEGTPQRMLDKAIRRTVQEAQSKLHPAPPLAPPAPAEGAPGPDPAAGPPTGKVRPLPSSIGAQAPVVDAPGDIEPPPDTAGGDVWDAPDDDDDLFADDALDAAHVLVVRGESQEQAPRPPTAPQAVLGGTDEQRAQVFSASGNARSVDGAAPAAPARAGDEDPPTLPPDGAPGGLWASDEKTPPPDVSQPSLPPAPGGDEVPAEFDAAGPADTDAADGPAGPPLWADASLDPNEHSDVSELVDDDASQTTGIHAGRSRPMSELQEAGLGLLIVEAPKDAVVFLDGNDIGHGRVEIDGLNRFQSYAVRVHHRGHRPWSGTVSLKGHPEAVVRPELVPR